ncbi:AGAP009394-PA-like protein [Anopheles sinensis]|uniref:AGAP009394-PA-like protein n=1 Tax=Anopheles sinensis TaxID=74873 RepID=A0A084VLX6_ANOSI|nr:AGAP009394-PA-like protein [Anopheles sinensis]
MFNFNIDKPPGVPHLVLKILKLGGISGTPNERYRHVPIFLTFTLMIAVPKIFFGYADFESTIIGLAELFFQINSFVGLIVFLLQNESVNEFIRCSQSLVDDVYKEHHPRIVGHLRVKHDLIHKATKFYTIALICAVNFYIFSPMISTLWSYYNLQYNNTNMVYTIHMEENFYNVPIRTSLLEYLLFSVCMIWTCCIAAYVGGTKLMTLLNFISYCTVYFHLVVMKIEESTRLNSIRENEKTIVMMHYKALRCAELMISITAPVLLQQLIFCVLIWSSMLLYFTVSCAQVARAIYDCKWEQQPPDSMKHLQLILLRAQKPVGITAGGFCFMDMEQFGKVCTNR